MNVLEQIQTALNEVAVGAEGRELTGELNLSELGIDSIKYVELLVRIEELCDITFDESDLGMESLRNIGDLKALIEKTLSQQVG
ncbi:acyl carrier protein [Paenibacillus athensensis]|uniref:Carrier domain-containing protein n=1 Tax=Paenibacillus athensensis TaxID=1967502 RepID=A0A4Y8Q2F8_9BACL|nr:acyl carrier protein [Paenibacillus athensensis]MCD1258649.1 acyl carrier protein [Paenibacillus athensensis]